MLACVKPGAGGGLGGLGGVAAGARAGAALAGVIPGGLVIPASGVPTTSAAGFPSRPRDVRDWRGVPVTPRPVLRDRWSRASCSTSRRDMGAGGEGRRRKRNWLGSWKEMKINLNLNQRLSVFYGRYPSIQ